MTSIIRRINSGHREIYTRCSDEIFMNSQRPSFQEERNDFWISSSRTFLFPGIYSWVISRQIIPCTGWRLRKLWPPWSNGMAGRNWANGYQSSASTIILPWSPAWSFCVRRPGLELKSKTYTSLPWRKNKSNSPEHVCPGWRRSCLWLLPVCDFCGLKHQRKLVFPQMCGRLYGFFECDCIGVCFSY